MKVSAGPCSFCRETLPCLVPAAAGCWRSVACSFMPPLCLRITRRCSWVSVCSLRCCHDILSGFLCLNFLLLIRTPVIGVGPTLIFCALILTIFVKTCFQIKARVQVLGVRKWNVSFWEIQVNLQHHLISKLMAFFFYSLKNSCLLVSSSYSIKYLVKWSQILFSDLKLCKMAEKF